MSRDLLIRKTIGGRQMKDPIVEEVRKFRMEHTRKHRGDLSAICADLHNVQISSGHKIVHLAPRKIEPTKKSIKLRKLGG
jgi:hypothetical protein